jgi:poly(3-hydroxybutyrate) depolymerase
MRLSVLVLLLTALLDAPSAAAADRITKETFISDGRTRTYYLYAPESLGTGTVSPLIVFLHGSGRNGLLLVDKWKDLAKKEGIILAGLDSVNSQEWNTLVDGPDVLHDLIETVSAQHPVDPKRVYLFGHSAGAIHGLMMALLESQYFAAAAVHAGALPPDTYNYGERATRKIPLAIWVGTNDAFFPLAAVRATRDALVRSGLTVELTEIKGHTHDYYSRSSEINKAAWAFLKDKALTEAPVFTKYQLMK